MDDGGKFRSRYVVDSSRIDGETHGSRSVDGAGGSGDCWWRTSIRSLESYLLTREEELAFPANYFACCLLLP